jgi:two-component system nitrogen regulation response regulator GlnG
LLAAFLPDLSMTKRNSVQPNVGIDLEAFISRQLTPDATDVYAETHREVDRLLFTKALDFTHGNHRQAARLLGIARQTMRSKLRALGLRVMHSVASDDDDDLAGN